MAEKIDRLLDAFGAQPEERAANRGGRLSPRQRAEVRRELLGDVVIWTPLAGVWIALCAWVIPFLGEGIWNDGVAIGVLCYALFYGSPMVAALFVLSRLVALALDPVLSLGTVDGAAQLSWRQRRGVVLHIVRIDGKTFVVTAAVYERLASGERYRGWYTPLGRVLVMLEAV